ncbi:MAG: hypothetical protein K2H34_04970, partial [Lachnospiraceae bacterium]|nr:hypothetical protein [Lachnospiraceae bacterium]
VLYTITKVEKKFWLTHKDWKEFFVKIIYDYFLSNSEEDLITLFSEEYFYQFRDFVTDSR